MTTAVLSRSTFTTSRALEFFTEKELQLQIGYESMLWPLALTKELIDNALDACETAGVLPEITVTIESDAVTVQDNGPGLPETTLHRSLDYLVRVSDKSSYVSPTRGQLGNALKCVWAAPFVASGGSGGRVTVETAGVCYQIDVMVDHIKQAPRLTVTPRASEVKDGTRITMVWPRVASSLDGSAMADFSPAGVFDLAALQRGYTVFNPSATFTLVQKGKAPATYWPTGTERPAWRPSSPTSPHWYSPDRLRSLVAAYVAAEAEGGKVLTVREFLKEFRGLTAAPALRAVTDAASLTGLSLHDLVRDGDIDGEAVGRLLAAMKATAKLPKPAVLGAIGEPHLRATLVADYGTTEASIRYKKVEGITTSGLPLVLEAAFGVDAEEYGRWPREVAVGLNWTPALQVPMTDLHRLLGEQRVDSHDPVALIVHLACPRLEYLDHGKTQLTLPTMIREALTVCVQTVTKAWKEGKRRADRENHMRQRDLDAQRRAQQPEPEKLTVKDAAWSVMEQAYRHAAGSLQMAGARQVMYAARPLVLALTGGTLWKNDSYFTQVLLPDFIEAHPDLTADWDVVYDARGHLVEPHTGLVVSLGTVAVREYIASWKRGAGPKYRYDYALFVEKEGFASLLEAARIAERFDIATMSTKGMSTTAARLLIDQLSRQGVTILVARDFDKSGFTIARTIGQDGRRYRYGATPKVVDLGLRLTDIKALGLASEPVEYSSDADPRDELHRSGATPDECDFLVRRHLYRGWMGERVELNAMSSDQFIAWIEAQLRAAGVHKVVPDADTLKVLYVASVQERHKQAVIDRATRAAVKAALAGYTAPTVTAPADLHQRVTVALPLGAEATWGDIVAGEVGKDAALNTGGDEDDEENEP